MFRGTYRGAKSSYRPTLIISTCRIWQSLEHIPTTLKQCRNTVIPGPDSIGKEISLCVAAYRAKFDVSAKRCVRYISVHCIWREEKCGAYTPLDLWVRFRPSENLPWAWIWIWIIVARSRRLSQRRDYHMGMRSICPGPIHYPARKFRLNLSTTFRTRDYRTSLRITPQRPE